MENEDILDDEDVVDFENESDHSIDLSQEDFRLGEEPYYRSLSDY